MTASPVAIIGLGLIGGSLGHALKAQPGAPVVRGWDRDRARLELALQRGATDEIAETAAQAAIGAKLVIVAVPVLGVREVFSALAPVLDADAVVTDVASTKAMVCSWAAELLPGAFVGGHPMAGSERSGVEHASANLFAGATYCLTPVEHTPPEAIDTVIELIRAVGARPQILSPQEHDAAVAAVSHLPFLLSRALVSVTAGSPEWEQLRTIAAGGYRDMSRLAAGDPTMHRDICLTNAEAIRSWLLQAAQELQQLAQDLDDGDALLRYFERTKALRDAWLATHERGTEPPRRQDR